MQCGKSTLARTIVGLGPHQGGELEFMGADINYRRTETIVPTVSDFETFCLYLPDRL
jgi:ABC-type oligopeptide transport system ATPase subunit